MAFTVEDGTGLAASNAYLSVADADTYHTDRANSTWDGTDAAKQAALIKASQYVDSTYRFKGSAASAAQAMAFPRTGCADWDGNDASGVPTRIAQAVAELALIVIGGTALSPSLARGGATQSESVAGISITYMAHARPDTVYQAAEKLIAPYIADVFDPANARGKVTPSPYAGGTDFTVAPYFNTGMHDND